MLQGKVPARGVQGITDAREERAPRGAKNYTTSSNALTQIMTVQNTTKKINKGILKLPADSMYRLVTYF